jgi:ABC-2 type transport system permease protein
LRSPDFAVLLRKERDELLASRAFWLLLLATGALVAHAYANAVAVYAEMSAGALAQGLNPLDGIVVPTLGALDLSAMLLWPFVVIRCFASERASGAHALTVQFPLPLWHTVLAKSVALYGAWMVATLPAAGALAIWTGSGGHVHAPEVWSLALGHILRGGLTIGLGAAVAAVAASPASAAIGVLSVTLGTWALDYVAAAQGGIATALAQFTPAAALRVFERGELRLSIVVGTLSLTAGLLGIATVWLRLGMPIRARIARSATIAVVSVAAAAGSSAIRWSADVSEDGRNSFTAAEEDVLGRLTQPLQMTVSLAPEDPRRLDLERNVLTRLARTTDLTVDFVARGRTGLFATSADHYGEIVIRLGDRRDTTRIATREAVLEKIFRLAGVAAPTSDGDQPYPGYPMVASFAPWGWVVFSMWFLLVVAIWWLAQRAAIPKIVAHRNMNGL